MTAITDDDKCKTFQIMTNPLNSNQYPAIRRMLDEVFKEYHQHINRKIYQNVTDRLIRLYNCCVGKVSSMKVEFDQLSSPNQVTSSVTIYRQDDLKQHRHINVLSTHGPIDLFLPKDVPTANNLTIENFLSNISTEEGLHDNVEEIVTYFAIEFPDYVPYCFTISMFGFYEDRLLFVNHATKHVISVSITPLPIINRLCEVGPAEIHGFTSVVRH